MRTVHLGRAAALKILAAAAGFLAALSLQDTVAQSAGALPPPSATERRALGASIRLEALEIEGPALLARAEIDSAAKPYLGRMVTTAELRGLAATLTERLESAGYAGSRVRLPDQELKDGTVTLRLVPGRLTRIIVSPPTFWNRHFALSAWLLPHGEETLHLPTLQQRLALLRESGLVERVNAEVVAFDTLGSTFAVELAVEESLPFQLSASYANNRGPSIGARRGELAFVDRSLLGLGDALEARLGRTAGLDDSYLAYRMPVPRTPFALLASRARSDSLAVDPPDFRELDITAVTDTDTAGLEWAIERTMPFSAIGRYTHDRRRSRTELLGIPFSFVPGIPDGVSTARVHRFAVEVVERRETWSASGRAQWSRGTTNSEAFLDDLASDERFYVLAVSGAFVRQLAAGWGQVRARLDGQFTRDRLLPFEKLAIGGSGTVRGYRENLILRDTGVIGSIEWRTRNFSLVTDRVLASVAAFVDAGWGRPSHGAARDGPASIASAGLALRLEVSRYLSANIAWALPTRRNLTERRDLQDRGVHYNVALTWP